MAPRERTPRVTELRDAMDIRSYASKLVIIRSADAAERVAIVARVELVFNGHGTARAGGPHSHPESGRFSQLSAIACADLF